MSTAARLGARLAFLAAALSACAYHVVDPHPRVAIRLERTRYELQIGSRVLDEQPIGLARVRDVHQSLANGFRNAVGSHYVERDGDVRLAIDELVFGYATLGQLGKVPTIRYRGRWLERSGAVVAELSGVAEPSNPFERRGERLIEDTFEVLFENAVEALSPGSRARRTAVVER